MNFLQIAKRKLPDGGGRHSPTGILAKVVALVHKIVAIAQATLRKSCGWR